MEEPPQAPRRKTRTRMPNFREHKLLRDREAKRVAREQYINECRALKDEMERLDARLRALSQSNRGDAEGGCPLPWSDVATSMIEAKDESVMERQSLRAQVARCERLSSHLVQWMQSMTPDQIADDTTDYVHSRVPWKTSMLPRDEAVWNIGLQWYVKKMYFTTECHMRHFRNSKRDAMQVHVSRLGSFIHVQKTICGPMDKVVSALWRVMVRMDMGLTLTTLAREATDHHDMWYLRKCVGGVDRNCLHTRFTEGSRSLFGFRTIFRDLRHPCADEPVEDIQEWLCAEAIGNDRCLIRLVSCAQPYADFDSVRAYAKAVYPTIFGQIAHLPDDEQDEEAAQLFRKYKMGQAIATASRLENLLHA